MLTLDSRRSMKQTRDWGRKGEDGGGSGPENSAHLLDPSPRESQKELEKDTDGKLKVFKLLASEHRVMGSYF